MGATDERTAFRDSLFEAGLLFPTGVEGLYGRSGTFQGVADALDREVSRCFSGLGAELVHFPPVLARSTFAETNYLESFPDLMGSVHVFRGDDRTHRELLRRVEENTGWSELLEPGEVVLSPAACHPVYPLCTGRLPEEGRRFEVHGYCFRHEPSTDPARMQAFHMHEIVAIGDPESCEAHRDEGVARGVELLASFGLDAEVVPASDPFFGRVGTMLANEQLAEALKHEGVVHVSSREEPTAVMSGNCHRDHFGKPFSIETADGAVAHSACVAFGVDRVVLALLAEHGLEVDRWPAAVRGRLTA